MGTYFDTIKKDCSELIEQVCRYSKLCYERRLASGSGGNISVRVPPSLHSYSENLFLVTASGVSLRDVAPGNLVLADQQGKIVDGPEGMRASKEFGFHRGIFSERPDANAVIHVHPVHAVVHSSLRKKIPLSTISAQLKLRQGPVVSEAPPGSEELRNNVMAALSECSPEDTVLLLENHGIVTWGRTLASAFDAAELVSDTAEITIQEMLLSKISPLFPDRFEIVDFTAPLNSTIQCYPTDPAFRKNWHTDFSKSGVRVSELMMGSHTGTHVDSPYHFLQNGADIAELDITSFIGTAVVIEAIKKPGENVTVRDIQGQQILKNDIVLFRTGWEERACSSDFFKDEWPGFEPELLDALAEKKIKAVGGDIASADSPSAIKVGAPAHMKAFSYGIPIYEGLINLDKISGRRFIFIGLPLKIEKGDGSPVRAVGLFHV